MSKIKIAGLILLAGVMALASSVYWVTNTVGGRDFALRQAQAQLPLDTKLYWKSVQGTLAKGLQFNQFVYSDATQRFEATSLNFNIKLSPLLFGKVHSDFVVAKHVKIYLAKDETPFEFPRWPESLPSLDVPISVNIKKIHVDDIQFFKDKALVYALNTLDGGFDLKPGSLQISEVKAQSVDGTIHLSGYYQPNYGFKTKLKGGVSLNVATKKAPQNLYFSADGNATRFMLDIQGAMPEPISIRWQLQDQDQKPFWFLSASTERFEPRYLGLIDEHSYRVQLAATGTDKSTQISGELSRDAKTIIINPSTFSLNEDAVQLDQVQVVYEGATFTAAGSVNAGEVISSKGIKLTIKDFALPLAQQDTLKQAPVVLNSQLTWSGTLPEWKVDATGELIRGKESAKFTLIGNGSQQDISLSALNIKTAKGGLAGKLQAQWQPGLKIAFEGKLNQFDPSYFFSDFPGAINADVKLNTKQEIDKPWQGTVAIKQLGGQLRGRVLAGQADIRFEGLNISGTADVKAGGSHLILKGSDGAQLNVAAQLLPLNLNDINPQWSGILNGNLLLKGARANPLFEVQLIGKNVALLDYRAEYLELQGNTISGNRTQLQARGAQISGQLFEQIEAELVGKLSDAQLQVKVQAADFNASSSGRLQWTDVKQAFNAQTFQIRTEDFGTWQLQAPMLLQLANDSYRFSSFCLSNTDHSGRVCAEDAGSAIAIVGSDFPLLLLEPWLNNAGKEFTYTGIASFKGELPKDFSLAGTGYVNLNVPSLKIGVKSNTDNEVARIDDLNLQAKWLGNRLSGKVSARLKQNGFIEGEINTGFTDTSKLTGKLKVQMVNLEWLELFSLDIAQPTGQITGEVELAGTRGEPIINGSYVLKDLSFQIPELGLKLTDGQITAKSSNNLALLIKGSINSGQGKMLITGLWDPADQLPQPINLRLRAKEFSIADTPDLQLIANSDLILTYEQGIYSLDGSMDIIKGMIKLENISTSISISNDVVVVDAVPEKINRNLLRLNLNLQVSANDQLAVKGFGIDGFASGKLLVKSPYNSPTKLTGSLSLIGKYAAYGQNLRIKRGNLYFNNDLVSSPRLDILTERFIEDENITVGLEITGSAANPKTRVVSNPAMSSSDALSWLLFGRALDSVSAGQAQSINAKSMALNAGGSMLVGTLGSYIGLDQASISKTRALGDSTLTIGEQISPKFFVSYGVSLLGIGQVITLKYLLFKGLDITIDTEQTQAHQQSSAALNWRK
ncbi:MAG: translocation/assembly module TamB domain-containing protein [Arenimonas sp.]|nr:translocation/assembly module TamB domain-containing protein [Arenimonas sp.]